MCKDCGCHQQDSKYNEFVHQHEHRHGDTVHSHPYTQPHSHDPETGEMILEADAENQE